MNHTEIPAGEAAETPRRGRCARALRALLGVGLGLVIALSLCEVGFRYMLFSDSGFAVRHGSRFRNPSAFSNSKADSDYFKLEYLWRDLSKKVQGFHKRDPRLGWVKGTITTPSLDHEHRSRVQGRRPFLIYGDSFASCTVPQEDCWEGLIETSFLGKKLCVINYGVRGFGLDQIQVLIDNTIDLWRDQQPVVAVGILADDDLDRVVFDFRGCPKPVFHLEQGQLITDYPGEFEIDTWVQEHPPKIWSYLLRYLVVEKGLLPAALIHDQDPESQELTRRKQELSRALLSAMRERLEAAGVDYFFIVFEGPFVKGGKEWKPKQSWRVPFLTSALDELEIPWVSSTRAIQRFQAEKGDVGNKGYFIPDDQPAARHFTRLGNEAALGALLRGLHGDFEGRVRSLERHPVRPSGAKAPSNQ
jgi:hypothetical protein